MNINTIRCLVLALALVVAMACPQADALTDREALIRAHRGDTTAMRIIGRRKFFGSPANGTRMDRVNGFAWLEKAAGRGDEESKYLVGSIYCKGEYVSKNIQKGVQYLTDAANRGNEKAVKALQQLPLQYSAPWIKKKAEGGDMIAAMNLAKAYLFGEEGLSPNVNEAKKYFMRAYQSESSKAIKKLKSWPMSKTLPIWSELAESEHNVDAMLMLGKLYDKGGSGVSPHMDSARKYYSLAAAAGSKEAVAWMKKHEADYESEKERESRLAQAAARKDAWKHVLLQEPEKRLEWLKNTLDEVPSSDSEWNTWSEEFKKTKALVDEQAKKREREKARAQEWEHVVKTKAPEAQRVWLTNTLAAVEPNSSEWHMWNSELSRVEEEIHRKDAERERYRQWESRKDAAPNERIIWLTEVMADITISREERDMWKNELSQLQEEMKTRAPSSTDNPESKGIMKQEPKEMGILWESIVDHLWQAVLGLLLSTVGGAFIAKFRRKKK